MFLRLRSLTNLTINFTNDHSKFSIIRTLVKMFTNFSNYLKYLTVLMLVHFTERRSE